MKKVLGILLALLLCGCSAEQRLAYLLRRHPELRNSKDTVLVTVKVPVPYDAAQINIPMSELLECEPDSAAENRKSEPDTTQLPTFTVTAGNAKATLTKTPDGDLVLKAEQLPDTIETEAPAEVPAISVHDLPAEEKQINTFFRILGYFAGGLFLLVLILFILKKFLLR